MTSADSVNQTYATLKQNSELVNMINEAAKTQVDATLRENLKLLFQQKKLDMLKQNIIYHQMKKQ